MSFQKAVVESDGLEAILCSLRESPNHAAINAESMRALQALATGAADEPRLLIVSKDGIEAIIAAMTRHPSDVKVQEGACAALRNVSRSPANQAVMGEKGCVEVLISAMARHPTQATLLENAALALYNLSLAVNNKKLLRGANAAASLRTAIQAHPRQTLLVEWGGKAVANITAIAVGDGLPAVLAALKENMDQAASLTTALSALQEFASGANDDNRRTIVASDGVELIMEVMKRHPTELAVQHVACGVFRNMSRTSALQAPLAMKGIIEPVMAAMTRFANDAALQENGALVHSLLRARS
jgi:hypothetical protein